MQSKMMTAMNPFKLIAALALPASLVALPAYGAEGIATLHNVGH
jgi:hypothetical protein